MKRQSSARAVRGVLLAWVLLLTAVATVNAQTTTVIITRHAEKVDESADPLLSAAGAERATALRGALADAGVQAIYTTQYHRTRDTAAPLAQSLGIEPIILGTVAGTPTAEHARRIAESVLTTNAGRVVLVVGHSNTLPAIISALGGPDIGAIGDDEYGNLFVLQISERGAHLIRSRY
ncbi:hypothetical protein BH23GEM9_BH23GEM9_35630 [soil metagenome]